ncbi:DNA primase large subunit [Halolamina sp.]|jgi:DNA primase large subunit|uniref:DNA primase large subunit n=1 Tax=Halolamina sp. TaxID=1940283 RepID=UPI000223BB58|nr:DNA primase, large subunit [halophilic archaeon DL31]
MQPLHARYPFFDDAREAVGELGVSVPALAAEGDPAVERGRERVKRALTEGTTAPAEPAQWSDRDELLSYPVARLLVSLLASEKAVQKYAAAEASTAAGRFAQDIEGGDDGLRSTTDATVSLPRVLGEFDLEGAVREETVAGRPGAAGRSSAGRGDEQWFRVGVAAYLALSAGDWGEPWRLVNRELAEGEVRVQKAELYGADGRGLLVEAVHRRVAEGLPFELDEERAEALGDALEEPLSTLRSLLGERTNVRQIDAVLPELFPDCIAALRERAREEELDEREAFALLSFLAAVGLDEPEAVAFCADTTLSGRQVSYVVARVSEKRGAQYPPPGCETLAAYGICTNQNGHRDEADHPLELYRQRLRETPAAERVDWRDRDPAEEAA